MSTYVYGFTHAAHPLNIDGARGVGAAGSPVRVLRQEGLAAVVSDAPEGLRAKRRDVEAHTWILERLSEGGTVLPMRFGTVAPNDSAVCAELTLHARHYAGLLTKLAGKVELNVKAVHREDDVLRDLLQQDRALREWNEALRSGGGSRQAQIEFGEDVAAALDDRRAADGERVLAELRTHAEHTVMGPPVNGCFVNASFLVPDDERQAFAAAVARAQDAVATVADVDLYGPLPPYSFVTES